MAQLLPTNEYAEVEDRAYLSPRLQVDETNSFIENLRASQAQNNEEIAKDTAALGTAVPSNLGGLIGGEGYFTSRYQTPQANSLVANLRATAQAQALNQALANEQAIWKNRYQNAYRDYQRRQHNRANPQDPTNPSTPGGGDPDNINVTDTVQEISTVETEGLAKSRYQKLLMNYLQAGYPAKEAEAKAKEDFGKAVDVYSPVASYSGGEKYNRTKSTIGGNSAYIYTLPNGRTVLVDESKYDLVEDNGGYALKNKSTGKTTKVGE